MMRSSSPLSLDHISKLYEMVSNNDGNDTSATLVAKVVRREESRDEAADTVKELSVGS